MATFSSYVICTSPRSGSTLLCDLLSSTGVAGNPKSYFHRPSIDAWLSAFDLAPDPTRPEPDVLRDIFDRAIAEGTSETGMFGLRLQRHSFDFFMQKLAVLHPGISDDRERFEAAFGPTLFVHLTRGDKVSQAISHVMAEQTGLWHRAPDGTEIERQSPPKPPQYDAGEIRARLEELTALDRDWERWFSGESIMPFRLTYESLSSDPIAALRSVLVELGLDPDGANGVAPGVAKLADGTSDEWAHRFRRDMQVA